MTHENIPRRKADHLDLAINEDVAFCRTTTLFACVRLVHDALPELCLDSIDLSVAVLGKRLRAPLLIAGMTGGTRRARDINRTLASIAQERGYAFGLGSQRALLKDRSLCDTYEVRDVAPDALLLGNLGGVQLAQMSVQEVEDLVGLVGADALCIHLNPAMELVQPEGDRDFRGVLDSLGRIAADLSVPVVAKETGCGLSRCVARRLATAGIRHVDVSGAGGTSWVAVESHRAAAEQRGIGETFREWGIPTAACLAFVAQAGFHTVIASGGVVSGLDVARAIALGATAAGLARPLLKALDSTGSQGVRDRLTQIEGELRTAMFLTGSAQLDALRRAPRVIVGELAEWMRG
jgi:isopentenyl-diphosphate delta-isomerase